MNLKQLSIASFNLYNLNEPGLPMYADKTGWTQAEYDRKIGWTAHQLQSLDADVFGLLPSGVDLHALIQRAQPQEA